MPDNPPPPSVTIDPASITRWEPGAARTAGTIAAYEPGRHVAIVFRPGAGQLVGLPLVLAFVGFCASSVWLAVGGQGVSGNSAMLSTWATGAASGLALGLLIALPRALRPQRYTVDFGERELLIENAGPPRREALRGAEAVLIERIHRVTHDDDNDPTDLFTCFVHVAMPGDHPGAAAQQKLHMNHSRTSTKTAEIPYNEVIGFAAMLARELKLPLRVVEG